MTSRINIFIDEVIFGLCHHSCLEYFAWIQILESGKTFTTNFFFFNQKIWEPLSNVWPVVPHFYYSCKYMLKLKERSGWNDIICQQLSIDSLTVSLQRFEDQVDKFLRYWFFCTIWCFSCKTNILAKWFWKWSVTFFSSWCTHVDTSDPWDAIVTVTQNSSRNVR